MNKILNIYKPQGLTPLEIIKLVREKFPEYKDEKIGFAGRLDPLAHGVLLLMVGEETTRQKDQFLNLPKEYEFEILYGVQTDTYDVLGLLQNENFRVIKNIDPEKINAFITSKLGKQTQAYPPFSSKTVNGQPLFWWAKNNKLSEIKIPTRKIEIYDFKLLEQKQITKEKLKVEIIRQIELVQGDFRQEKIKEKWTDFFIHNQNQIFSTARFSIFCSSGTYVRSLANELGEKLGTGAITLEILRKKAGEYLLKDSKKLS